MKKLLLAAAAALSLGAAAAPAQALVIGTADTSNSIPFGGTGGSYYFQQVYSAASLGAIDIDQISFYDTLDPAHTTPMNGSFQLYLSYSNANIAGFDTTDGVNSPWFDSSFVKVFDGAIPALANGQLNFKLSNDFSYDPSKGNLMLTVRNFELLGGGNLFLDVDQNNTTVTNSRIYAFKTDWNQGLVTGFNAPVPEPTTWALMIGGFGLAGARLRRRRALAA